MNIGYFGFINEVRELIVTRRGILFQSNSLCLHFCTHYKWTTLERIKQARACLRYLTLATWKLPIFIIIIPARNTDLLFLGEHELRKESGSCDYRFLPENKSFACSFVFKLINERFSLYCIMGLYSLRITKILQINWNIFRNGWETIRVINKRFINAYSTKSIPVAWFCFYFIYM